MGNNGIFKSLFALAFLLTITSIGFSQNSNFLAEASPLDAFQQYREEFGISTARVDMEDNGVIDDSVFTLEFENFDQTVDIVPIKTTDPEVSILIKEQIPDSDTDFIFHWEQDQSISGYEISSYINEPLQVTFFDESIKIPDNSASLRLEKEYGILLSNEKNEWEDTHSYALLELIKTIPLENLAASKWILTDDHIEGDIKITKTSSHSTVEISTDAFENAIPKIAEIDGKQGKYFSQRLHHALVWFVTDEGKDSNAIEKILNERYGVSTRVSNFEILTQLTTKDTNADFQQFHAWELVEIINMFEEMPEGFHEIDGLNYLVRRGDGLPHPLYPNAPAVAWASANPGYIEFMETAFTVDDNYLHRLIIHEKTHFLWDNLFSENLKNDWIALGGWSKAQNDSGWITTKTTAFASPYAHLINPEEDMAESIAYYVIDPDKLKSRALPKYEFIQDRIMQGTTYISQIRDDLTFEVYNLFPDYLYPGKINRVDVSIIGESNEDKQATVEIELNSEHQFQGASSAHFRLFSEIGTFVDFELYPIDSAGTILKGQETISKYAKNGFWHTNQIRVEDSVGNQRFEGQNDFGWKFYINNPMEDITPPEYVKNSLKLALRDDHTSYKNSIQILTVSWQVVEDQQMKKCYTRIDHEDPQSYSMDSYGSYDSSSQTCNVEFNITEFNRSGLYYVKNLIMTDMALNSRSMSFPTLSEFNSILIDTTNPDSKFPYLDVNTISISAVPSNVQLPNGETHVHIEYYAKDDKSGLGKVKYALRDPQGILHTNYHYHDNFHTLFFAGNVDEVKRYDINLILPEGSAPGVWGLAYLKLSDKANNQKTFEFTEIIHFKVN